MKERTRQYLATCLRALSSEMRETPVEKWPALVTELADAIETDGVPDEPAEPLVPYHNCTHDHRCRVCGDAVTKYATRVAEHRAWTWRA